MNTTLTHKIYDGNTILDNGLHAVTCTCGHQAVGTRINRAYDHMDMHLNPNNYTN